jgi:hypothetical protein
MGELSIPVCTVEIIQKVVPGLLNCVTGAACFGKDDSGAVR